MSLVRLGCEATTTTAATTTSREIARPPKKRARGQQRRGGRGGRSPHVRPLGPRGFSNGFEIKMLGGGPRAKWSGAGPELPREFREKSAAILAGFLAEFPREFRGGPVIMGHGMNCNSLVLCCLCWSRVEAANANKRNH